jgi:hypothetical protein
MRLMESGMLTGAQTLLYLMLFTLWAGGFVRLDPGPPGVNGGGGSGLGAEGKGAGSEPAPRKQTATERMLADALAQLAREKSASESPSSAAPSPQPPAPSPEPRVPVYQPLFAHPTETLPALLRFRGINPLYGMYLVGQLGIASREERIQALESVLEMPGSVAKHVRVPRYDDMPPGPLATTRLDSELLQRGLATPEQLGAKSTDEESQGADAPRAPFAEKVWPLTLGEKLRLLFDANFPHVHSLMTTSVWSAGEVLEFGGQFNKYITSRGLQKQEGVIFRHLLRLILLLKEFEPFTPPECPAEEWLGELREISAVLTDGCRRVDPTSTDKALEEVAGKEYQGDF